MQDFHPKSLYYAIAVKNALETKGLSGHGISIPRIENISNAINITSAQNSIINFFIFKQQIHLLLV